MSEPVMHTLPIQAKPITELLTTVYACKCSYTQEEAFLIFKGMAIPG